MDFELMWLLLGLMAFGGFVWALAVVSFKQGLELGKRMAVAPVSRPGRAVFAPQRPLSTADTIAIQADITKRTCLECHVIDGHAHDCPQAKPKPDRRRWMGFSRIKAELENKESA